MAYKTYNQLHLPEIDQEILAYWEDNGIFQKSVEQRPVEDSFVFYEGPPSANGKPGIHHVMARTVKDLFCRYHSMKGKRVERKGGWDTHGLPIELSVEKELGITKEDIGKSISVEEYNQKCRETVMRYKDLWDRLTRKMGYWVDLDDPYITFTRDYIESVWHLLKKLHEQDLLYKGYTIQPFSPAAGTGLSSHELNQPGTYKEVKDTTIVAQFELSRDDKSAWLYDHATAPQIDILAWTTTPWTLPSNTALSMGPKIDYILVDTYNPYTKERINVVLAEALSGKWFRAEQWEDDMDSYDGSQKLIPARKLHTFKGAECDGMRYEQLMPYAQPEDGDAFMILLGNHVTTEDGTGIVHTAPSFGADDMMVAKKYGVGSLTLVDKQGKFVDEVTDFAGRYVKNYKDEEDYVPVDIDLSVKLKLDGRAFNIQKYEHNYPHCWRTDKPILYYPLDSWFIKTTARKDRLIELNKTINWKPAHTGEKRFGNWLENLQDWNLSRSRFWGIPLPIWRTADGSTEICIGSIEQLSSEIEKANRTLGLNQSTPDDLHKPYIDDVILVSAGGEKMLRESDLIDVWFDSGSMPYAQWHHPFENEKKFQANFPADFIAEGVDQTRGWFFTLHAIATMVYDQVAYKNVVSNGLVQDKHGRKMSKRLGNAVEPFSTLDKYGVDATRWYMMSNAAPWDNLKFDEDGIVEVQRKFFNTLFYTYGFYALYANIDSFTMQEEEVALEDRPEIDRWILSCLQALVEEVDAKYKDYDVTPACRAIHAFVVDQLSNWYVRLCRRRFWKGEYSEDKISAYQTLYTCLETVSQLMAPVAPFYSDWLFQNLTSASSADAPLSVHLTDFPSVNAGLRDVALERRMDLAQRISSLVLSLRKGENIRVRQPLRKILVPVTSEEMQSDIQRVESLITAEVNVKMIEYVDDSSGVIKKAAKPNFKVLGKKLGATMKAAAGLIAQMSQADIQAFEQSGAHIIEINGTNHELTEDDIIISSQDIEGWLVASDRDVTVALDITLDEELRQEGLAKELVNRIQNLRKDKDFDVMERIDISLHSTTDLQSVLDAHGDFIKAEVLADQLSWQSVTSGDEVELVDDITAMIDLKRKG